MTILQEFKAFATRGNVIDLAIGVIIGASFTAIVTSLVKDVVMPPVGLLLGGIDFANFFVVLKGDHAAMTLKQAQEAGSVVISYGLFVNAIVQFLIVAVVLFLLVRQVNKLAAPLLHKPGDPPPPPPPEDILLLREIRDALKARG